MKILGTGVFLPETRMTTKELGHDNAEWVEHRLGIKERRYTYSNSAEIGAFAAIAAIKDAHLEPEDIDLIIVATSTPAKLSPSTACIIQDRIGARNAVCFDINAVCSGFVYALSLANHIYGNLLIIGTDTFSHITDWGDRNCVFFGDGAGAVVVHCSDDFYCELGSDGRGQHAFETEHGGTFCMDGKKVYQAGTHYLPIVIEKVLEKAGLRIDDISCLLPHQASINMLKKLALQIGLPWDKVRTNMDKYGNTAAASIPILLHESKKDFKKGDYIMMAAIGSGWTYGAIILQW